MVSQEKFSNDLSRFFREADDEGKETHISGRSLTAKERRQVAEKFYAALMESSGYADIDLSKVSHTPRLDAANVRSLDFVRRTGDAADMEVLQNMMQDSLGSVMASYIEQSVKRSEYTRRFGENDKMLTRMLDEARTLGASEQQVDTARNYIHAQMGTLGFDMDPQLYNAQSWVLVYQNVRLLALSVLTNTVDLVGIAARGGEFGVAWDAYKQGLKEIRNMLKDDPTEMRRLGEDLGIIERHMISEALGFEFGGNYMSGTAKKINEAFFRYNGMQGWNRFSRTVALAGGQAFLRRHGQRPNSESQRYLEELGLQKGDLQFDDRGNLKILNRAEAEELAAQRRDAKLSDDERAAAENEMLRNERVETALLRFVDQSILRPNASVRPLWGSDPHYALAFHLQTFMFAFDRVILRRVMGEATRGNLGPAFYLLWFVPGILAADALRETIKHGTGDEEEDRRAHWDWADWAGHGIDRSGIAGVNQIWLSAAGLGNAYSRGADFGSLLGPTVEQATDMGQAVFAGGEGAVREELERAMPLQTVLRPWFLS